jgi:hypothetical protein
MGWMKFVLAVVVSGVAASFTDWVFMGMLFHRKYFETPEVWRLKPGGARLRRLWRRWSLGW